MASVWGELKRRNVVKVAVAYAVVGWLVIEIASVMGPALNLPEWTTSFVAFLLILGFPVALVLSWAYELTPEGMKRSHEVSATESIAHVTGRKIDFAIIGALVLALGFVVYNYVLQGDNDPARVLPNSVAVLPFENLSLDPEDAFFATGIHEEVLNQLAKLSELNVIARTSMMQYANGDKAIPEIAEELNVETVMEGSVRYADDRVLVTAQLIDPETNAHLWSDSYNREFSDIFSIQADIAMNIANALEAEFSVAEQESIERVPTENTRAYEFYLSGNDYAKRPDDRTFAPLAVEQYQRAVSEDPQFALAWAALSRAHSRMFLYTLDSSESRLEAALNAVERAFELVPGLPEAHLALGQYYYHGFRDYTRTLEEYSLAEQGMPGSAELFEAKAFVFRRMGQWEESLANMERAIELDPRNLSLIDQQGNTYSVIRRYADAERYFDRVLEIAPDDARSYFRKVVLPISRDGDVAPAKAAAAGQREITGREYLGWFAAIFERDYTTALSYLDAWEIETNIGQVSYVPKAFYYGATYLQTGQRQLAEEQFDLAREQLEAALERDPEDARIHSALAQVLAGLGDDERAVRAARRAMELMPRSMDALLADWLHSEAILNVFIPIGDYDTAIAELDAYFSLPGRWSIEGLSRHPSLEPILDDPRFQALVEKYRRR